MEITRRVAAAVLLAVGAVAAKLILDGPMIDPCKTCFDIFPAWICYLEGCGWLW